jgi:hypothetical protein
MRHKNGQGSELPAGKWLARMLHVKAQALRQYLLACARITSGRSTLVNLLWRSASVKRFQLYGDRVGQLAIH